MVWLDPYQSVGRYLGHTVHLMLVLDEDPISLLHLPLHLVPGQVGVGQVGPQLLHLLHVHTNVLRDSSRRFFNINFHLLTQKQISIFLCWFPSKHMPLKNWEPQ